ncbi:hypothetical protein G7046_g3023 [Stylonectria norvegica]|nr:hypothetical protein G7046_g3023 [Stylonectria norvegica]
MDSTDAQIHARPVVIAPAPANGPGSIIGDVNEQSPCAAMPYTCLNCAKRKVKCDKATPKCSSCRKTMLECLYQAPQSRWRKRKMSDDVLEKLARYENILHQHGLLDAARSPASQQKPEELPISLLCHEPATSINGKLLAGQGKTRYINSGLWRDLEEVEIYRMSDDEIEDSRVIVSAAGDLTSDPLTAAFLGSHQSLHQYHPSHAEAMVLWQAHVENVEPLCKILHVPSIGKMIEFASSEPSLATKTDECLMFAIYHFAISSMTDHECSRKLGQTRTSLLQRYHLATRQALVNAFFLKTTELPVLQALILFLLSCRYTYDPQTYWILTGVAVRIAQRMGIHQDGQKLGLPPFAVQMRRRLFYQLLPLDGVAGQLSGTGIPVVPDGWDLEQPLNINDDQIWPGMTETPKEQRAATDMIFCLSRSCIGKYFIRAAKSAKGADSRQFRDQHEAEILIKEAEREVEDKYIRYCDMVNPLHFLTICMARSGITAMRLKTRLSAARNPTATNADRRDVFQLARKNLDTDAAVYAHVGLRKYQWYANPLFLWGTWDSLIFVLTTLWKTCSILEPSEQENAWSMLDQFYQNHNDFLVSRRALHVALGRLALKAWDAHPPSSSKVQPAFITVLRFGPQTSLASRSNPVTGATPGGGEIGSQAMETGASFPNASSNTSFGNEFLLSDSDGNGKGFDISNDFEINAADWMFWDQLIQNYQT